MKFFHLLACLLLLSIGVFSQKNNAQSYYQLKVYHFKDSAQEKSLDDYLQQAYIPAMHEYGIKTVGIFKTIANDTAADKTMYVLTPFATLAECLSIDDKLRKNDSYQKAGGAYLQAVYNKAPYTRVEIILLHAFKLAPSITPSQLNVAKSERLYELRSYESPTEQLNINKVKMFNEGGEIEIFSRLGFNSVFYGNVITGSHMPNLMYMTTYENKKSRDEHWKAFGEDAATKKIFAMDEYKNNVSKAEIIFLRPAEYSDL